MKKMVLLFSLVLTVLLSNAQEFSFNLYFEDGQGNKDTLVLGYDASATDSIDANFGEVNIISQAWDSVFEARCVNFDPDWYTHTPNYSTTFHTKKQIIEYSYCPPYNSNHYYSNAIGVMVKNAKPPFVMHWDSILFQDSSIVSSGFQMYHIICDAYPKASASDSLVFERASGTVQNYYIENNDTLWFLAFNFASYNTTGINTITHTKNTLSVYPNPASSQLNIKVPSLYKQQTLRIIVYNSQGKEIDKSDIPKNTETVNLNINKLPSGIYYLHMISAEIIVSIGRFIKI